MTPDELSELAAGYALGALEGDERARFEALVPAPGRLRELAAALRAAVDGMAP